MSPLPYLLLPLLFLLLLALLTSASSTPYLSVRCNSTSSSPYPGPASSIASSSTSSFYAISTLSTVTIHSSTLPFLNSTSPPSPLPPSLSFTSIPSPCFTSTIDSTPSLFTPLYARHLALQSDLLVIGNPSSSPHSSPTSFLDLLLLSSISPPSPSITYTLASIYSLNSPYLGLAFSLSPDAAYLAAYLDPSSLIVLHPVWARASDQPGLPSDVSISLPPTFYADSLDLHPPYLHVTGVNATGTLALPTLLVYTATYTAGEITSWTLAASLPLPLVTPATSPLNSFPPLYLPARALPVASSSAPDTAIVVGAPSLSAVFLTSLPSLPPATSLQSASATGTDRFGLDVQLSDDGGTAYILAAQGLLMFPVPALNASSSSPLASPAPVDVTLLAESMVPNRLQTFPGEGLTTFAGVAVTANLTTLLSTSTQLFLLPSTTSSLSYSNADSTFTPCPAGSYLPSSPTPTSLPCQFCPVGTYTNTPGSTSCTPCDVASQYCPAGSVWPYTLASISEAPESSVPEFESESFSENFEDLLINGIFNPSTVPMVVAFVVAGVTGLCVALYAVVVRARPYVYRVLQLYSFALMPDEEEEKEKEEELKLVLNELLEQREKTMPRCPHAVAPRRSVSARAPPVQVDGEHEDSPYIEHGHGAGHARGVGGVEEGVEEGGSARMREVRASQQVVEEAKMSESIMKGFFNVLLLLFGVSCIVFSWTYLNHYEPNEQGESETNNRYRTETLYSVTITDDVKLEGLDAINSVNATLYTHLIGYSGMECSAASLLGLQLDGCIIQQNNQPCNQSAYVHVYESDELPHTCTIEFNLVQGTLLALMAVQTISLPASLQVQALRYVFLQDAQDTDPTNHIVTGPTLFWDTATHPQDDNGTLTANGLAPYVRRDWVFGILSQAQQIDENTPPDFAYTWYNTVTSLNTPWLPTLAISEYPRSQAASVQLVLTMQTETFFRLQTTQKLIQVKAAFLTILLGLIAIFHLIEFAKQAFELVLLVLKRIKKNRAVAQVSQLTTTKLNQVVDASFEATGKVMGQVKHGVERVKNSTPLGYMRNANEPREEKRGGDMPASPPLANRFKAAPAPPPPFNPHYSADPYPLPYPPVTYPPTYAAPPAHLMPLPPSMLPYPVSAPTSSGGGGSRGGSRAGSRRNSGAGASLAAGISASPHGYVGGAKFEI